MRKSLIWQVVVGLCVLCIALCLPEQAQAATGTPIPELTTGLGRFRDTMTGPVTQYTSAIAFVIGAVLMFFGGDLGTFGKTVATLLLAVSVAGAAAQLTKIAGVSGAMVTEGAEYETRCRVATTQPGSESWGDVEIAGDHGAP